MNATAQVVDVPSEWLGTLQVPGQKLRLVMRLSNAPDGRIAGTLISVDQGSPEIPASRVELREDSLIFEVASINGVYRARVVADSMTGTWRQGGAVLPLTMKKTPAGGTAEVLRRPQEPTGPLPYHAEEVTFENRQAGIRLAGTLTLPATAGPHPAIALVSGSGPQDRNESLMGHKPFLVLADYLTREGFAVLRYDDRGVGASTGDFGTATTQDFAGDALSAVAFLKTRKEVDASQIGLLGHSEGGIIVPIASDSISFAVLLAPTGVPGDAVILDQQERILRAESTGDDVIRRSHESTQRAFEILKQHPGSEAEAHLRQVMTEGGASTQVIDAQVAQLLSPWFRYFLSYDPAPALHAMHIPVLVLIGEKDLQVSPALNMPPIREALAGNARATIREMPGLNHLLQTARTGSPTEYSSIEETISPTALQAIAEWMKGVTE